MDNMDKTDQPTFYLQKTDWIAAITVFTANNIMAQQTNDQ